MNSELVSKDLNEVEADAIFDVLERKDELEAQGKDPEVIALINTSLNELPDQEEATEAERFNAVADLIAFVPKIGSNNKLVTDLLTQPLEEVSGEPKLADYVLRKKWLHDSKIEKIKLGRVEWSPERDMKHKEINEVIAQINQQLSEMDSWDDQEDDCDEEYKSITPVSKQKRKSELHELIKDVCLSQIEKKGCSPTAKELWKEIANNHGDYCGGYIVEEVKDDAIYWRPPERSDYSDALTLKFVSFQSLLSRIKKDITAKSCG
jgi:hypothetical protein